MMSENITRKKRGTRVFQLIYRLIASLILKILDGRVSFYMRLQTVYLRSLGVEIAQRPLYICADAKFDSSDFSLISIGKNVVISSEVRILTHDYSVNKALELSDFKVGAEVRKLAPVILEENCFIGMRSLILPGVTIGKNSIIGAGSIVTKSIPKNVVAAGNPARVISTLEEYIKQIHFDISNQKDLFFKN